LATLAVRGPTPANTTESNVEKAILSAENPLAFDDSTVEHIEIDENVRGVWLNKAEQDNWKQGELPIDQYEINNDLEPTVISKRPTEKVQFKQNVAVRYLNPQTPPAHGPIIMRKEPDRQPPAAPALILRQPGQRPQTPAPLVIREAPPRPPTAQGSKIVTIAGKVIPPPARKVVLEKLADEPEKPRSIMIEKWLPYKKQTRRVLFEKLGPDVCPLPNPKNVVIEWEKPDVEITHEIKDCGVERADPEEYIRRYGAELSQPEEIPDILAQNNGPVDLLLPVEEPDNAPPQLIGNEEAMNVLKSLNLEEVGLGQYQNLIQ
jgi:hypothetical protein